MAPSGIAPSGIALIAALGNPGNGYAATRHNAGLWFLERLQLAMDFTLRREARFKAKLGGVVFGGRAVRVMAPSVFMNLSGQALAPVAAFYRIPAGRILVVHDDIDLPPGRARLKMSGGHGGHNGLRDIIARLGSRNFPRLRIGVGHPGAGRDVSNYVLSKPAAGERVLIDAAIERAVEALDDVVAGDFDAAMARLHREPPSACGESRDGI